MREKGLGWDREIEITEHHAIMDNLSLSVAFFPLCLFLLLEIPDRSRMCYRVWVIGKKGASSQSYSQKHEKEGQFMGGDMGCGCRGLCRGDDNI